jgi:gliding motility-associated-like protein
VVVWFSVTQNQSCGIAKDSVRVRFTKSPSPLFVPSDSVFCVAQAGSTVALNPVVAGGTFSGTGVSGTNFIVPSTPGTYPVKYIVALNGCTDSLTRNMVVNTPTSAAFSLSDTFVCLGTKTITVTPTNTGGAFSGVTLVGNVFTPTVPGIFTISYVIGSGACKDSVGKRIYVSPQPDARFAASDSIFCLGDAAATFTPTTPGGVFTGNHVSANTFTPLSVGPHTVKYVVTSLGCTDSTSRNMLVNAKPDASFVVSDSVFCIGDAGVTFVPTQTGGTFSGTGVSGNSFTPTVAGSFVVSYVLDNGNCKDSVTHTMTVNPKPDASFTTSDTVLCEGDAPAALTPVNSGGVFSGGQVSGTKFTPTTSGLYPITYKLSNGGCVDSVTHYIRVAAKPTASFTYAPQKIMVNDTVQFTYTGNGANAYVWSFGDGGFATVANPSHSFANEQVFTTWLVVSSLDGCLDSTYQAITVEAEENLFVPNVFTPNGDSVNDRFVISHMGIHDFNLFIYNRWGGLVFETKNPDVTWDGKFAGEICVEGVYVYLITYKNAKQATKSLRGTVTLIR